MPFVFFPGRNVSRRPLVRSCLLLLALGAALLAVPAHHAPAEAAPTVTHATAPAAAAAGKRKRKRIPHKVRRITTANLDFRGRGELRQLQFVLKATPGIVLVQEAGDVHIKKGLRKIRNGRKYRVVQFWGRRPFAQKTNAVLFKKKAYRLHRKGNTLGFSTKKNLTPSTQYLTWAVLKDRKSKRKVAVISVHLPPFSTRKRAYRRVYKRMAKNYMRLARYFHRHGRAVIAGGDWNQSLVLDRPRWWDPVTINRRMNFTLNWRHPARAECTKDTRDNRKIDGFGYHGGMVYMRRYGCRPKAWSDHRPVWMRFSIKDRAAG